MFHFSNLQDIKKTYAIIKETENDVEFQQNRFYPTLMKDLWKSFKLGARKVYNSYCYDQLSASIMDSWRCVSADGGETGYDYTIIPDEGQTDEEIAEYMHDSIVYCGHPNSPYDCTGERVTLWWSFKRTPAGITLIHAWGIDV